MKTIDGPVLVTGSSGFIGSNLCQRLVESGIEVHGLCRNPADSQDGVRNWSGDAGDANHVRRVVRDVRPSVIYHLASHVAGSRALEAVQPTFQANLVSTVNVLTSAAETGSPRVVLAGSLEEPDTTDEPTPVSPYAAAKWASSGYGRMFHVLYDLPVITARIFMVFGPGQRNTRMLVPYVVLSLLKGTVPKLSSGQRPVDWVFIDDVVRGLHALGAADQIKHGRLDLGSGQLITVRELVEKLVTLTGSSIKPHFGAIPDRPRERVCRADIEHTRNHLGWSPEIPIDQALSRTIAWYRDRLLSDEP